MCRKALSIGDVTKECDRLIRAKRQEKGWKVVSLEVLQDHVQLFARVFPTDAAATVVKEVKGFSAHALREAFPVLKHRLPSLWTRSYFAATAGNVSADTIRRSIEGQKGA